MAKSAKKKPRWSARPFEAIPVRREGIYCLCIWRIFWFHQNIAHLHVLENEETVAVYEQQYVYNNTINTKTLILFLNSNAKVRF